MPYDEDLAARIRDLLAAEPDLVERKMFGGLAFLLGGHMTVAAVARGGAMVRVGPEGYEEALAQDGVEPVVMRERPMTGWVEVAADRLADEQGLSRWVDVAVSYVHGLPPKRG